MKGEENNIYQFNLFQKIIINIILKTCLFQAREMLYHKV